jgi:Ca-activated chloride channel family protein
VLEETIFKTEGIDIVLTIDASGSMAAEDFKKDGKRQNRLAIVKDVVQEFVDQRQNDRIGLVAFGGVAYTVCPLTTDYSWLSKNLERITLGLIEDGTAIGSGIASSVARLRSSEAKSKVIVLLTDGIHNAGKLNPLEAARVAESLGIKIYTIGAGTKGYAPFPATDFFGRTVYQNILIEIDEKTLQEIAKITGGQYFRATDTESLRQIYKEIDALEKTKIEQVGFLEYEELFHWFLLVALIFLLMQILLEQTVFLKVP